MLGRTGDEMSELSAEFSLVKNAGILRCAQNDNPWVQNDARASEAFPSKQILTGTSLEAQTICKRAASRIL